MPLPNFLKIGDELFHTLLINVFGKGWNKYFGKKDESSDSKSSAEPNQSRQRRDWLNVFFSDHLSDGERVVFHQALGKRAQGERDKIELALGELFSEGRDGTFSNTTTHKVVKTDKKAGTAKGSFAQKVTTEEQTRDLPGFHREKLTVQMMKNFCKNEENANILFDLLIQKPLINMEDLEKAAEEAKKMAKRLFRWSLAALILFLILTGTSVALVFWYGKRALPADSEVSLLIKFFIWFFVSVLLLTPIARLILPKGDA